MTDGIPAHVTGERFAERLQAAMSARRMSHRKLAKAVGASQQSVTNWTQGHNEPSLRHLRAISRALDVPPATLLEGSRTVTDEIATASDLVRELVALRQLAPAIETLAGSTPSLLDLLARAERHVRAGRGD